MMSFPMTTPESIDIAWRRIERHVRVTPTIRLNRSAFEAAAEVFLKLELMQVTGSFKPRGAFNRILSNHIPESGVIAASGGNHGLATAYAARALGHRAEIFVPAISSPVKQQRLRDYGADLHVVGANYNEALQASNERARETGALVVHAYDQVETIEGQGTCGREFDMQVPGLDTILVAAGGGGFIAGIAAWFRGKTRIIAVEPRQCCCLWAAFQKGEPTQSPVGGIAADSLGSSRVGELAWEICRLYVDRAVLVEDDSIRAAQRWLWQELRVIAEPGGATALAALLSGAYSPSPDERIGVVVCGGNTELDGAIYGRDSG
jgi:threonine dehydratase